ncbi:CAP domain-containing protein [Aminivibrio sp.]|uniref:CAP domain-containing protein n=1 Tax=Aminivibrio sp. TaxID=1872489 RepID=UPI00345EAE83
MKKEEAVLKKMPIGLRSLAVLCLTALFLMGPLPAAFALKLTIRNDFADSLNTAVVYYCDSTGAWTTRGWYVVRPRESRTINFSTSKPTMYLHSYLSGRNKISWGKGDITRVVMSKAFVYEDGETCPAGPDRRTAKFTRYAAKNGRVNYSPVKTGEPLPAGGGDTFSAVSNELLKLINADRRKTGARDLKLDATLSKAAARRASEQPKVWGHTRPNGKSYSSVFAEFNLNPARSGENVASNTKPLKASHFHEQFMNSPGHKKVLLNPDYSVVGLGFHQEGGRTYCVELFAGEAGDAGSVSPCPGTVSLLRLPTW